MTVSVGSSSTWSQLSSGRTISALASQIARYVGGESDGDLLGLAHECLHEAIQSFNSVPWKFNRVKDTITLTTAETYSLDSTFRSPLRSYLLDSNSERRDQPLRYVPYSAWNEFTGSTNFTTSIPEFYTIRNPHADGLLTLWPPPGSTLTYPTVELNYHKWIAVPSSHNGAIDLPRDVEQAILAEARALIFLAKRDSGDYDRARRAADKAYLWVANTHMDHPDLAVAGAGVY